MCRGTIVDGPLRRPGVFEPRSAASALPQSDGRANPSPAHFSNKYHGIGLPVQNLDVRPYQSRLRQGRTSAVGTWFDVLHDVEATVLWPQVRERRSSFDVLVSQNKRYVLGRGSSWLPGVRTSILSRADNRVHHFGVQVVGRNSCSPGLGMNPPQKISTANRQCTFLERQLVETRIVLLATVDFPDQK